MVPLGWTLLLLLSSAKEEDKDYDLFPWRDGEFCRSWAGPKKLFWCPRRRNGIEAKFCCGNCSLPYCCSSEEDRLDPQQCPQEKPTSQPPQQHLVPDLWLLSLLMLLTTTTVLVCIVCLYCFWDRGGFRTEDVVAYINQGWTRLRGVFHRPPPSPSASLILDSSYDVPPPPYSDTPLPSFSEEDSPRTCEEPVPSPEEYICLVNPENPGGEAGAGSLVHRNVPFQVLDSSTEAESSV